jgi:hypothetical protein
VGAPGLRKPTTGEEQRESENDTRERSERCRPMGPRLLWSAFSHGFAVDLARSTVDGSGDLPILRRGAPGHFADLSAAGKSADDVYATYARLTTFCLVRHPQFCSPRCTLKCLRAPAPFRGQASSFVQFFSQKPCRFDTTFRFNVTMAGNAMT